MRKLTDKTKGTLLIVFSVMIAFTLVNVIKGTTEWYIYLLSLVVFPLITWGETEIIYRLMKKDYEKNLKK